MYSRRGFLPILALSLAAALPAAAQPRYNVSAEQLRRALAQRFPASYSVRGMLDVQVQAPRLRFMPQQNRLGAEFDLEAAGPALRRRYAGTVDLDFALRYESADQTLRAHQLQLKSVQLPGLPPQVVQLLDAWLPPLIAQSMAEVVVHRLRPADLALADSMGLEPDSITVVADGLMIGFAAAARPRPAP